MTKIKSAARVAVAKRVASGMERSERGRFTRIAAAPVVTGEAPVVTGEAPVGGTPVLTEAERAASSTEAPASRPKDRLLARLHRAR